MSGTMTAEVAMGKIQAQANKVKSNTLRRLSEAASPGIDGVRQGDIYIRAIAEIPAGAVKVPVQLQLADGETQGSRHCLDAKSGVTMFRLKSPGKLDGPLFRTTKERVVTHPEHAHVALPAGCYRVTFQRDLDAEEGERRVLD